MNPPNVKEESGSKILWLNLVRTHGRNVLITALAVLPITKS